MQPNQQLFVDRIDAFLAPHDQHLNLLAFLTPEQRIRELQLLDVSVPRQTGKSTALLTVFNHLPAESRFLIYPTQQLLRHHTPGHPNERIVTLSTLTRDSFFTGRAFPDQLVFLCDELSAKHINDLIDCCVRHRLERAKIVNLCTRVR